MTCYVTVIANCLSLKQRFESEQSCEAHTHMHTQRTGSPVINDRAQTSSKPKNTGFKATNTQKSPVKKDTTTNKHAYLKTASKPLGPNQVWAPKSN